MPDPSVKISGRMLKVPEGHLAALLLQQVRKARRQFMGKALAFGAGSAAMAAAPSAATQGEAAFLELPEHTKGLGLPVVTDAYGKPSKWETDIQRRIEVGDQTWFSKDEELHCIDLMPDGTHRQFTSVQECKSVITTPSGSQTLLDKGFYNITGLAWSGRGAVKRVDISTDGGRNWRTARLEGPVLKKALTRFNIDWVWDGSPAVLQSRAIDDTGYVQPKLNQLRAVRGTKSIYHNNGIQSWRVAETGEVTNVQVD